MMDGSRWYFPVFEGLFEAKHVEQMGPAIWLYGWILARAWVAQKDGVVKYNHVEAAEALGQSLRNTKLWFSRLQEYSYLITRARHPYSLDVQVTNWRRIEEWLNARQSQEGDAHKFALLRQRSAERSAERSADLCIPSITIRLLSYNYPSGSDCAKRADYVSLSDAFRDLCEHLRAARNKPAVLREIYRLCFGGVEEGLPDYGYLGKVAKAVGGAGRLAEIMWQLSTKPPTGDILAYILAAHGRKRGKSEGNGRAHGTDFGSMTDEERLKLALARNARYAEGDGDGDD